MKIDPPAKSGLGRNEKIEKSKMAAIYHIMCYGNCCNEDQSSNFMNNFDLTGQFDEFSKFSDLLSNQRIDNSKMAARKY